MKKSFLITIFQSNRFIILVLAFFIGVAFHNCLQNDFIGDDKALFGGNQFYKSLSNFPKIFSRELVMDPSSFSAFQKEESFSGCISYRPVSAATFFLDYALWKENPKGHHFSNIVLHFLTCVLVFYFILLLSENRGVAFWTASLFAVHPIQSEVVNSSGYRSDILMVFFYLSALLAYWRYSLEKKRLWFLIAVMSYFLALFSKETALTFAVSVFFLDYFFITPQSGRKIFCEKKGLYLAFAGASVFYLYVYFVLIPNAFYLQSAPLAVHGLAQGVLMFKIFAQYLAALCNPATVSVLPPLYAPAVFPISSYELFFPICALVSSIFLGAYFYRRNKVITFGLAWFFINYFPTSGFFPLLNALAFRFLYLPSIGFFLISAVFIRFLGEWLNQRNFVLRLSFLFQSALMGLLIALTIANNAFFKNNFVACREMIRRYPDSSRPYWILGLENYLAGDFPQAVKYFQGHLSAQLNNPFISSDKEKFMTYHLLGRSSADPDVAIGYFGKALAISPGFAPVYLDLSRVYIIKKDYLKAMDYARHAAQLDAGLAAAYVYMIHIEIESGNLKRARELLEDAQGKFPRDTGLAAVGEHLANTENKR